MNILIIHNAMAIDTKIIKWVREESETVYYSHETTYRTDGGQRTSVVVYSDYPIFGDHHEQCQVKG